MSDMSVRQVLEESANVLERNGCISHIRESYDGRHCALGAMDYALRGYTLKFAEGYDRGPIVMADHPAVKHLAKYLIEVVGEPPSAYDNAWRVVEWFNKLIDDDPLAGPKHAIDVFRAAAATA